MPTGVISGSATMRACDEIRFDVGGRTIAGKRFRGGHIPTIALHGWLDNANSFDAFAQAMPELDLFAMDFAGHGRSDPRAPDVGYWGWLDVQDVIAAADPLGWPRFVIVAHSMGAEYSTQLAGIYPERVSAQICIDGWVEATSIDTVLDGIRENLDTCLTSSDATLRPYASLETMAARLEEAKGIEFAAARALVERGHRVTEEGYIWSTEPRIRRTHTQRQPDDIVVALAKRTKAPTLMIAASGGEAWFRHSLELVRGVLADFEEISIDGPHHLHMSAALPEIVDEVRRFLRARSLR
jgi:pimeloyl-ACP methyl ester carboxylesterase